MKQNIDQKQKLTKIKLKLERKEIEELQEKIVRKKIRYRYEATRNTKIINNISRNNTSNKNKRRIRIKHKKQEEDSINGIRDIFKTISEEIYNFLQQHIYSLDLPEIKKSF